MDRNSIRNVMVRNAHPTFFHRCLGESGRGYLRKSPLPPTPKSHALNRRRRRLLVTTETELMAMAAAARAGFMVQPHRG
jgi:hypothetical protein